MNLKKQKRIRNYPTLKRYDHDYSIDSNCIYD